MSDTTPRRLAGLRELDRAAHTAAMNQFPLHAKSSHPDVVAAVTDRDRSHVEFREKVGEFATAHGFGDVFDSRVRSDGSVTLVALHTDDDKKPKGRWKKARHGGWMPAANNPALAEFEALKLPPLKVPGYPTDIWQTSSMYGSRVGGPRFVLHDGVVYARIPFRGECTDNADILAEHAAAGWVESLESEWQHAHETAYSQSAKEAA